MKRNYLPFILISFMLCFCAIYSVAQHPAIGNYNVYYGHLHNHTAVSDGSGTPEQAYDYAKNIAGLDFFSLSDHSELMEDTDWTTIKNVANAYNDDGTFTTFYGFEWSSVFYGHVSVFNTDDRCSLTSPTSDFSGLLAWLNARNGIAFFNHPGWAWWALQEFNRFTNTPSARFVGMELWNDVDGFNEYYYNDGFYSNDGGKGYFDEALIRGWKIGAAGSDDNHVSTWGTRTPWRIGVLANCLTRTDIMDALIARRFFSTLDKNLSLSLKINGAEMGSTVIGGNLTIEINAKDEDANEAFTKVVLMKNGAVAQETLLNPWVNNVSINYSFTGVDKDYFYVKVTQTDGDEAISSPVFIEGTANQAPLVAITSPANGSTFNVGDPINIVAAASDADGTIAKVEFYQATVKLGEDATLPYECQWTATTTGTYSLTATAFDNMGASIVSVPVTVTVNEVVPPEGGNAQARISSGNDDAEQYSKGTMVLTDKVLNIVYESKLTGNQTIGLLFRGLDIPQGATINRAYLEFAADIASSGTCSLTIKGEATDNAANFTTKSKNLSSRIKTVAGVSWKSGTWTAGATYQTNDITSVIQEIVNRSGWQAKNNLVILITGKGTRIAESYEGSSENTPFIYVDYTLTKSANIEDANALQIADKTIDNKGILIYPNPVHDILTVRFDVNAEVKRLQIYSITGSLVKEITINNVMTETQVDCSNFVPGTYVLKLSNSKGNYSMQFIKQ